MSGPLPPGWYPAPGSPQVLHWWDGIRWTGETREADSAGQPASPSAGETGAGEGPAPGPGAPPAVSAWRAPAVEAWQAQAAPAEPVRRRRWLRRSRRS